MIQVIVDLPRSSTKKNGGRLSHGHQVRLPCWPNNGRKVLSLLVLHYKILVILSEEEICGTHALEKNGIR